MAAGKRYSAGRIFLQVVPSFENLQKDIQRAVNKTNPALEKQQEEIGRRHEEARQRGAEKVRREAQTRGERNVKLFMQREIEIGRNAGKEERKREKERAAEKERIRKEAADRQARNSKAFVDREMQIARNAAKERAAAEKAEAAARERAAKAEADRNARNAKAFVDREMQIAQNAIKEARRQADQARKDEAAAQARADREREAQERRNEQARLRNNRRQATERLQAARAAERERQRVAGGAAGRIIRKNAGNIADEIGLFKIDADSSPAKRKLAAIREELLTLRDAKIGVDMDIGEAQAKMALISKELEKLDHKRTDVDIDTNLTAAMLGLKRYEQQLDQLNRKKVGGSFASMFAGASAGAGDGANSFRIFNYRVLALLVLLPLLAPALASAAGALGAIGTAAIGGAAGLGVMILGFTGLSDAISAMGDVQDNMQKETLANTKAIRNAARGVRDAQQGVTRAQEDAARSSEDASRRVADARKRVVEVERDAARSIRDALRAQSDAEKSLADAQKDATQAQRDLIEARRQAQRDQQDLADKIASGQLDERQALIDLFEAQVAYNNAMADGASTNLDREKATIDLERARLAIKGIRQENKDLVEQQKKGAAGDQNLASAQERAASAAERVQQAQRDAADAAENVADTRRRNAENIAEAERGVTDALRDQQRTAVDNARQVRDAQERLADALAAQQEAITKTSDIGSSSVDKLRTAMAKLGPEGQAFATFIFGLRDTFYELRDIVQAGMLPPLQEMLSGLIQRYGPEFKAFLGTMGKTIGDFFTAFGKAMQSPVMVSFFETMAKYAPTFFTQFGDLFINILKLIGGLATAFAPFAKEFMDGFVQMSKGWADWAAGLAGSDGFNAFIEYVKREGPKVLGLIGDLFQLILNIGKGMADTPIFDAIAGFFKFLASLDPKIVATLFTAFTGLAFASQVAAGVNALIISIQFLMASALGPWVLGIMAVVVALTALWTSNEDFRNAVSDIWTKIQGYIGMFVDWIKANVIPFLQNEWLPTMTEIFKVIGAVLLWVWNSILKPVLGMLMQLFVKVWTIIWLAYKNIIWPMFKAFWEAAKWVYEKTKPFWDGLADSITGLFEWISHIWDVVGAPFFDAIIKLLEGDFAGAWETAVKMASSVWNELGKIVATPVNFIIGTVLNDGLYKGINNVLEFLGLSWRIPMGKLIQANRADPNFTYKGVASKGSAKKNKYAFATGGVMPGWSPGRDIHHFVSPTGGMLSLSGGESIMRPEFTALMGGEAGIAMANELAKQGKLPWQQFASGGVLAGMVKPVNASPRFPWGHYPSGRVHRALDLPVREGTPVVSPFSGTIIRDGWDPTGFGTHVRLAADNGTFWILGHLLREIVSVGQRVLGGTRLGDSGNTGNSTGPHLHLEGRMSPYDPSSAFNFTSAFNGGVTRTPPAGSAAAGMPWWADKPIEMLRGLVNTGIGMIPFSGGFIDMLKGFPNKIFDGAKSFLSSYFGGGDADLDSASGGKMAWNGREVADNGTMMYDSGGMLMPGVTQVLNMTGRPEPVFTADQWASRAEGGSGRGPLIGHLEANLHGSDVTAGDFVEEIMFEVWRADHAGKYAGRLP